MVYSILEPSSSSFGIMWSEASSFYARYAFFGFFTT
jgi:hypothetical protein